MHFDYRGSISDAMNQLTSPDAIALAKSFRLKTKGGMSLYAYGTTNEARGSKYA